MADDGYRGYGGDNGRGRGGSEPPTDPLTELARLIGQSDPFGDQGRRADPRASADWRDAPQQPAQHYDDGRYDDRYAAPQGQPQYPQEGYPQDGHAQDGYGQGGESYAANYDTQNFADDTHRDGAGYQNANGYDDNYPTSSQAGYAEPNGAAYDQPGYDQSQANGYDQAPANGRASFGPPPYLGADPHAGRPDAYYDDTPSPRRRGWLVTVAALAGLAVLGTAGAFAYRAVFAGGPPPLITRDVRPDKVVPPAQNADNSTNKQLDRLATNEQMAPPPEQPINIPATPPTPPAPNMVPAAPVAPSLANQPVAPPAAAPATPSNPGAPRKIRTVKISGTDQEPPAEAPRPIAPRAAAPHAAAPPPHNSDAPLSLAPQSVNEAPAPTPTAPPRAVAPPMRTTALAPAPGPGENGGGGNGYYVQVSAQKSQEEARSSFRSLQAKYANLLGGHAPVFRRKDLGSKGVFYGAQVGPFSHEAATHLCEQLRAAGGSCMIQRN
jgi:hypothetical protein